MNLTMPTDPTERIDRVLNEMGPRAVNNVTAIEALLELLVSPPPIEVEKIHEDAKLPKQQEEGDAGTDLYSYVPDDRIEIGPGEQEIVPTGLRMKLPPHTELQIRPRSGLAIDHGLTVLNTPGTVDEGYRGEIGVVLINHGNMPMLVGHHLRIAQAVLKPALEMEYKQVESVDTETERGEGGFGSTGNK